jgi:hypothetical protein
VHTCDMFDPSTQEDHNPNPRPKSQTPEILW